jgi:hypothetical protein
MKDTSIEAVLEEINTVNQQLATNPIVTGLCNE